MTLTLLSMLILVTIALLNGSIARLFFRLVALVEIESASEDCNTNDYARHLFYEMFERPSNRLPAVFGVATVVDQNLIARVKATAEYASILQKASRLRMLPISLNGALWLAPGLE